MGRKKEQAKITKEAEKELQLDLEESFIAWKIDWKKSNGVLTLFMSALCMLTRSHRKTGWIRTMG